MDKVLFVATVDQHIRHFHYPILKWLKSIGYEIHVASNGKERLLHVDKKHDIPFDRHPIKINNIKALKQLKKIIELNDFKFIHCHTPVGGVICRLAAKMSRNCRSTIIYTAHGFHFYKGAPLKNWIIYYSIEKLLSKFTDILITINEEDYKIAVNKKFGSKRTELVNGVGVNLNKFRPQTKLLKQEIRKQYGYFSDDYILFYAGELSYRKNQEVLLRMVKIARNFIPNLKLLLAGDGKLFVQYKNLVDLLGINNNVDFLGYRDDVSNLLMLSDLAVSSSRQEGLPLNVMEAMATGLPLVVSDCRGNRDLVKHGENGYLFGVDDYKLASELIVHMYNSSAEVKKFRTNSLDRIKKYSEVNVLENMKKIYDFLPTGSVLQKSGTSQRQ